MTRLLIIPAAGRGSRLGAGRPKPLVHVNGRTMLDHLADLYRPHVDHVVVVAHPAFAAEIEAWARVQGNASVTTQDEPTGMLDAILLASPAVRARRPDSVWITWADQIGVLPATVRRLADVCSQQPMPALALPTVLRPDPYTHFERDSGGRLSRFLQRREGDTMPAEGESDMGLFALARDTFEADLVEYPEYGRPGCGDRRTQLRPVRAVAGAAEDRRHVSVHGSDGSRRHQHPEELRAIEGWLRARGTRPE